MQIHSRIVDCAKYVFPEHMELIKDWEKYRNDKPEMANSSAYLALYYVLSTLIDRLGEDTDITMYKNDIYRIVNPFWGMDHSKDKDEVINELFSEGAAEAGSSIFYHKIREAISRNQFENREGVPTYELETSKAKHIAQLLTDLDQVNLTNAEVNQWEKLMTNAITSMDDLTADIFDSVSILWMKQANNINDMISFSHEDVLKMRKIKKKKNANGYESYRKTDRAESMKRLAALASIWVHVEEDDIHLLDVKDKDFKKIKMKRLFQVDNVTIAHDRKTNEAVGIFECEIRPGELLASYLYGANKSTGYLSLKALQYNPVHFKYHKRLTRYLSWQWRIRSRKSDFARPYSIGGSKGLLNVIGMEINEKRPSRTRESFDKILDTLQNDGVIQNWYYVDADFETNIGKVGWLDGWLEQTVVITPPSIILSNQKLSTNTDVYEIGPEVIAEITESIEKSENEVVPTTSIPIEVPIDKMELSPDMVMKARKKRNLSIAKAAAEIGMAHTTLSRWERGLINKPNTKNTEKLKKWLAENQ